MITADLHPVEVLGVLHHHAISQDHQVACLTGVVGGERGGGNAHWSQNSNGTGRRELKEVSFKRKEEEKRRWKGSNSGKRKEQEGWGGGKDGREKRWIGRAGWKSTRRKESCREQYKQKLEEKHPK